MAIKQGQIRKRDIPTYLKTVDIWYRQNSHRWQNMDYMFSNWVETEVETVIRRIKEQDYLFCIQSLVSHLKMRLEQFEAGDIARVERDSDGDSTFYTVGVR